MSRQRKSKRTATRRKDPQFSGVVRDWAFGSVVVSVTPFLVQMLISWPASQPISLVALLGGGQGLISVCMMSMKQLYDIIVARGRTAGWGLTGMAVGLLLTFLASAVLFGTVRTQDLSGVRTATQLMDTAWATIWIYAVVLAATFGCTVTLKTSKLEGGDAV